MIVTATNLLSKIRQYKKQKKYLEEYLSKKPNEWPKFQMEFNSTVEDILQNILQFEQENLLNSESKVYKLKKLFEKRFRAYFLHGEYVKWSYEKPYGYPGDFKIIDDIYLNQPHTTGFERLWDNCFQELAASKATRERKEDFKQIIFNVVKERQGQNTRIMNLASGPAREIKELMQADSDNYFLNVTFDCYDFESNAINYAKQLLNNLNNVNFFQKNVIRLALKKDIKQEIPWDYDLIYSTGFFDYLDERVAVRLINNLIKLLKKNGLMVVSNYREKQSNTSAYLMEWIAEWNLIYRSEEEFKKLFIDAGFSPSELRIVPQKSKVMQYCFARLG